MSPLATVAVVSIGEMGLGIAKMLVAHDYRVVTNISDRSAATQERASSAAIETFSSDEDLVAQADYFLSIVPPRDAVATAKKIIDAFKSMSPGTREASGKTEKLYYLDLNAIAPSTARSIADLFSAQAPDIYFLDGGIIGGPPSPAPAPTSSQQDGSKATTESKASSWTVPDIPLSGPHPLTQAPHPSPHLASALNTKHLGPLIGDASGVKCTFASLSKGFTALALQAFSTADAMGVLPALQHYLDVYNPSAAARAVAGITRCPGKAYRWVEEMRQIDMCFEEEGGWGPEAGVFGRVAGVFQELAAVVEERGGVEGMRQLDVALEAMEKGLRKVRESR